MLDFERCSNCGRIINDFNKAVYDSEDCFCDKKCLDKYNEDRHPCSSCDSMTLSHEMDNYGRCSRCQQRRSM
jgi:hypothetical protein